MLAHGIKSVFHIPTLLIALILVPFPTSDYQRVTLCCAADIDECAEKTSGCEQKCTDNDGSFTCSCNEGYTLKDDNITCKQG